MSRSLQELSAVDEPAWPTLASWIAAASIPVEVLDADETQRATALVETQVTLRSPVGAVIYQTGGILVDSGWLRILGSGSPKLPRSLPGWNRACSASLGQENLGYLLVADDVVGGFFAVNGGAFRGELGRIFYYAPDSLRWEALGEMAFGQFLVWSFSPAVKQFYQDRYWDGWESELAALNGDEALSIYPFLWTVEGKNIAKCSRRPCPVSEIFSLNMNELPKQLLASSE